jgi:predicted metal-dependent hydrolase
MTGPDPDPTVRIIRSARRRRTAAARAVDGAIEVRVPAGLPAAEETRLVDHLVRRITRRRAGADVDLAARAGRLARRYELPQPARIDWADNQSARWGSCTPSRGTIRISRRLAAFPGWVVDYVIVHELAHLEVHGHGPAFWELVNRYPRTERARGFLIAKGLEEDGE